jgi:ABC-type cobalamin/Fe3+-siderophores transport system ATPase subunit
MTPLVSVAEVSWRIGSMTILDHVSLEVGHGELVALMGRNGAGKSTLMDLVAGIRRPSGGAVVIEGRPLEHWAPSEKARAVAHLPQALRADLPFSAEQLVLMGRYPHADRWFESEADRAAVEAAMRRTGSAEFRDRRVSTLSGGERQRVLLAACLAQEPKLLLLDEPSTFLDIDQQLHCFSLLREQTQCGASCIAVTHDLNLALTFCSRLVVLAEGRIALDCSAAEAAEYPDWLGLFSPRLRLNASPSGRPWVSFA